MKKLICLLLYAVLLLVGLTGCSNALELPIIEFIDECIDQFANNHQMLVSYNGEQFIITEEQWQAIRSLFNETTWTELENYQPKKNRDFEGFMSFCSIDDTIGFFIPECVVLTIEFNKSKFVRNRYFTIDEGTVELIEAQLVNFIY